MNSAVVAITACGRASMFSLESSFRNWPRLKGRAVQNSSRLALYNSCPLLVGGGSMIWFVLMIYNMAAWKRDNPGQPVRLPMFAITATALLWAWTASGVILELLGIILPRVLGLTTQIDAGLARTLFSVTLHAIVYFWLMPAYIAFYTLVPQAAGVSLTPYTLVRCH